MLKRIQPHTFILIASLPLIIYSGWVPFAKYITSSNWQRTRVASAVNSEEKCQAHYGKGGIQVFNYKDRNMYVSRYWDITYEVKGQKYPMRICTDAIDGIKTIYYDPDNPVKAEPELAEQHLHNLMIFLAICLFVGVLYIFVRTLPTLPTRPSI